MSTTTKNPFPPKEKPLTEEEKKMQIARFFQQKRESFAQGILFNLVQSGFVKTDASGKDAVTIAVTMADALINELYPVPKDE